MRDDAVPMVDFEKLLEPQEFRWPRTGDHLFVHATKWESSVRFSDHYIARDSHIWSGYMEAASVLIDHCQHGESNRHNLVYAIVFNYRHGLEAAIKWILDMYGPYAGLHAYDRNHDLKTLWTKCREIMVELGGGGDLEADDAVETIVSEFHAIDPASFAFRYSKSKAGKQIDLPNFPIDLLNLQAVTEGLDNFFTGLDGQLDALTSSRDLY